MRKPSGFWRKIENQRTFIEEIAKKLSIKSPRDWGQYTAEIFTDYGGRTLSQRYNGSLQTILKINYPNIEWKPHWFAKKNWREIESQRNFILKIAKEKNLKFPEELPKIQQKDIEQRGGLALLKFHNCCSSAMLQYLFPEWKLEWFSKVPKKYWSLHKNQRTFFDNLANKFNIKNPKDWGNISSKKVRQSGGGVIVGRYFPNLFETLKKVYPDVRWNREWFQHLHRYDRNFFKITENQKQFLNEIASDYGVDSPEDWHRITLSVIKNRGGQALLKRYKFSIAVLVKSVYGSELSPNLYQSFEQRSTFKSIQNLLVSSS